LALAFIHIGDPGSGRLRALTETDVKSLFLTVVRDGVAAKRPAALNELNLPWVPLARGASDATL
jgi:hypothetical protein